MKTKLRKITKKDCETVKKTICSMIDEGAKLLETTKSLVEKDKTLEKFQKGFNKNLSKMESLLKKL